MDYLLGLRIIIALSMLGVAVLVGSKLSFLGCQNCSHLEVKQGNVSSEPLVRKKKKLKDDFWDRLTHSRS